MAAVRGGIARKKDDGIALRNQQLRKRGSDQAGSSGNDD
jgi:hypothetical protein